jgi:hypothetical protein
MDVGDLDRRLDLDHLYKVIFEELDPLLSSELWHDFENPLHDTFFRVLWEYYQFYGNPLMDR